MIDWNFSRDYFSTAVTGPIPARLPPICCRNWASLARPAAGKILAAIIFFDGAPNRESFFQHPGICCPVNLSENTPVPTYGISMSEAGFWVIHRRRSYGPFDYQFSGDLDGIEFLYQGEKYGECCSSEEFFADLHPYRLPQRVSEAATVVTGTVTRCIFQGIPAAERFAQIAEQLRQAGLDRYRLQEC